jgi:alpha-tubulin suppressor-like RCC1 family protein
VPTAQVPGFAFNSVAAGLGVSCGITTAQALVCWGAGYGATPVEPHPGVKYKSVSVEQSFVCGLDAGGQPCAGTRIPYSVVGQANTARHICQIFGGGQTECYGDNSRGQLGISPAKTVFLPDYRPNVILNFSFQSVVTGYDHSCALSGTDAFCWGGNYYGQLGGSSSYPAGIPGKVQPASGTTLSFTKISVGDGHSCAIANNTVFCWGRDDLGQLGIGSLNLWMPGNNAIASVTPLRVVGI